MLAFLASVITLVSKLRRTQTAVSMDAETDTDTAIESSTSEELLAAYTESQLGGSAQVEMLTQRMAALEDRLKTFQETLLDDSAYASSDVTDLTSWLGQMENKIAGHITEPSTADEEESAKLESTAVDEQAKKDKEKEKEKEKEEKQKKKDEAVAERVDAEQEIKQGLEEILEDISTISSQTMLSAPDLQATNERVKKLAYNLNDQMHQIRDKVFLLDHELKRMAKGVEFALMRAKVSGINEMVSLDSYLLYFSIFFFFSPFQLKIFKFWVFK